MYLILINIKIQKHCLLNENLTIVLMLKLDDISSVENKIPKSNEINSNIAILIRNVTQD